jgi:hypothetical protein
MTKRIRDRYTGKTIEGDFVLADDYLSGEEGEPECPTCGAEWSQSCTSADGEDISPWAHRSRAAP